MLTQFHKILIAALGVQLVLAVIVLTRGDDSAALKEHPILAGFDAAKVTQLKVFAKPPATDAAKPDAGKPVELARHDKDWVLASGFDFPVESKKVDDVLSPIAKLSAAAPIATQAARHKQLHVADDDFERKLVISAGGKDVTLFVGGSAGARRTAVRLGGDDRVYAVTGLNAFSIGAEPRLWIDTAYVKIPRDEIAKLVVQRDGKAVEMMKSAPPPPPPAAGGGSAAGSGSGAGSGAGSGSAAPPTPPAAEHWSATIGGEPIALATGESLDEAAFDRLAGEVATLDLSAPGDPKRDASKPTATITIERKATGTSTTAPTVIDVIADGSSYWVHDRSLPRAGLVDKARLDEVLAVDRDKLVKKPPPPEPKAGAGSGSAAGTGFAAPGAPGAGSASPAGKGASPPAGKGGSPPAGKSAAPPPGKT